MSSQKITQVQQLRDLFDRYDLRTPIHPTDLQIDNSDLDPDEVVTMIGNAFGLIADDESNGLPLGSGLV